MARAGSRRYRSESGLWPPVRTWKRHWRAWGQSLIGSHLGSNKIVMATMLNNVGAVLGLL